MKKPTDEELALGLDPNKYSQDQFNSAKYITNGPQDDLAREVEKMKQIKAQQSDVLGHAEEPTDEERQAIREQMIKKMRGY